MSIQKSTPFPTQDQHARAWETLAEAIANAGDHITEALPAASPTLRGSLTIIGSGIESLGFTIGDEEMIRAADAVFYCVADPATVTWLKELRPDAYDLYVLYRDNLPRYVTYMQMTEAMLHFVRQGKKVVGIYYGHPGIFVLSTHRAIMVARREGHHALMRAGVCALDCLCADLGVDPCHPGMQTYEATDMLIRRRVLDTTVHVVLWQVGLIGELGFRRKGYINENFSILISYLQKAYGDDYPVTHYVASRYPTIPPLVEVYPLRALHDPATQARVTGISTFYLAPKNTAEPVTEMLLQLGLIVPGQSLRQNDGPLRQIGRYGARERRAFKAFRGFKVPVGYHWQNRSAACRFLIALRQNMRLAERYRDNPREALESGEFADLSERERALLVTRDPGAIQVAAKGTMILSERNRKLLRALFTERPLLRSIVQTLRASHPDTIIGELEAFSERHHRPAEWARMRTDIDLVQRDQLFPWIGVYHVPSSGQLLVLIGKGAQARLFVDGIHIRGFSFKRGVIQWAATSEQRSHGFLRVDVDTVGRRRLIGSIWPTGEAVPTDHRLVAIEGQPGREHLAMHVGSYRCQADTLTLETAESPEEGRHLALCLNGERLPGPIALRGRRITCAGRDFELGTLWSKDKTLPRSLNGLYSVKSASRTSGLTSLRIEAGWIELNGGHVPAKLECDGARLSWEGGPPGAEKGHITTMIDPIALCPVLFGAVNGASVVGLVPTPVDLHRPEPQFGLSAEAWQRLVAFQAKDPWGAGVLLWSKWERADLCAQVVNKMLARLLP